MQRSAENLILTCVSSKIALEVGEGRLRPALPKDDGQYKELIDLICCSWNEDASTRPSFAIITSTLRRIKEKFHLDAYSISNDY